MWLGIEMISCTIFVIWNDEKKYIDFLESIHKQKDVKYSLVSINNEDNKNFNSARYAYNSVLHKAEGKYIFFMHPDVIFMDEYALKDVIFELDKIKEFGIVGIAGCKDGNKWNIYSNAIHGLNKEKVGISLFEAIEVQTVDECLFIVNNEDKAFLFSNEPGWHMYSVEECLKNLKIGKKNYVIPVRVWHQSAGNSLDPSYMKTLENIIDIFGSDFEYINTTVKQWKTRGLRARLYRKYYYYKQIVKRRLL